MPSRRAQTKHACRNVTEVPSKVPLGFLKGSVPDSIFDPLPEEELKAWETPL